MEEDALLVFAASEKAPPLRTIQNALRGAGHPASLSLGIAGDAAPDELETANWDAAFVRWTQPELHDAWLIERALVGEEEQAELVVKNTIGRIADHPDAAGRLIVADHLRRAKVVYGFQILPALLGDDDHPGWQALDVALTALAQATDGLIHAQSEGFYDENGELLLSEDSDEMSVYALQEPDEADEADS